MSKEYNPCPKPPRREKKSAKLTTLRDVRYNGIDRKSPLKAVGKRGKRREKGIEAAREHFSKLPCICGRCNDSEPKRQWCHLDGRSDDVIFDYTLAVPG